MLGASTLALMGLGVPGELAQLIGADYKLFAGVGTVQTGAKILISQNCELTASAGQTAFILGNTNSGGGPLIMDDYWLTNQSSTATAALIYVPSGHKLNGVSNDKLSLNQFQSGVMWQYKYQNWTFIKSA